MRTLARRGTVAALTLSLVALAACAAPGLDADGSSNGNGDITDENPGVFDGTSADGGSSSNGVKGIGADQKACASSFSESTVKPVNLVFMYDESSSMTQPTGTGLSKWDAAKSAITAFTTDSASSGLSATIEFFSGPAQIGQPPGDRCQASTYSNAAAGPVALPDTGRLIANAIGRETPNGNTASYYAMLGARQLVSTVLSRRPNERAAIIFVTDGIPEGCDYSNSVDSTAGVAAQALASGTPTYVIGVGNALSMLNTVARSGGTGSAHIVDTNGDVSSALLSALKTIRGQVASCSLAIPAPPNGKQIDYEAVNVGYNGQTLGYNKTCVGGAGWHYDNASNPKSIELCATSCSEVKRLPTAKVSVAFGCATKGGVVR